MINYSIIIPHHNLPQLLIRCLNSIPERDDIQVIVVDDNSSPDIVDFSVFPKSHNSNVEFIFDKVGGGAGHARNIALKKAKGKWIIFVDADDFLTTKAINELDKYKDSDADIIMFKIESVTSETLEPIDREGSRWNKYVEAHSLGKIETRMMPFYNLAPWSKMISSELLWKNKIEFDNIICAEDIMFSTKLACNASKIIISQFPLYVVTHREGSLTLSSRADENKFLCRLDAQIRRNIYMKDNGFECSFLTHYLIEASKISFSTLVQAFSLLAKNRMITTGLLS